MTDTIRTVRKSGNPPLPRTADLEGAFEGVPVGLYRTRPDGTIVDANPTLVRMLGFPSRAALLAINAGDLHVHPQDRQHTLDHLARSGSLQDSELELRRADGRTIWVTEYARAVLDAQGRVAFVEGALIDISERRAVESALQRREAILEAVAVAAEQFLQCSPWTACIDLVLERIGRATGVSRAYLFAFHNDRGGQPVASQRYEWADEGISPQIEQPGLRNLSRRQGGFARWAGLLEHCQVVAGHVREFSAEEQLMLEGQEILSLLLVPVFVRNESWGFLGFDECRIERQWSEGEIQALRTAAGALGAAILRQEGDDEFRRLKDFHEGIVQRVAEGIVIQDPLGVVTFCNPAAAEMMGYAPEELVGMHWTGFIPEEQRERVHQAEARRARGESDRYEIDVRRKDGSCFCALVSGSPRYEEGSYLGTMAVFTDISQQRRGQETIREAERKYRRLVEQSPAVVYMDAIDDASSTLYMSPQITELVGYTPEEWIDDSSLWLHLVHPDDRLRVSQANQQTNDTGDPFVLEYRMFGRDGRLVWVRDEAILVRDESDTPRFWQGVMIDITHRKVAEEALRETNEALSALIESSPLAIVSLDLRGRVMLWNPAAERLFGWQREEVIGRRDPLVSPGREGTFAEIIQSVSRGEAVMGAEVPCRTRDGRLVPVSLSSAPLHDAEGTVIGVMEVMEDVTERQVAEQRLARHAMEMAALYETALEVTAQLSPGALLEAIIERATRLLGAAMGAIYLLQSDGQSLELVVSHHLPDGLVGTVLRPGEGLSGRVAESGEPLMVQDYSTWPGRSPHFEQAGFGRVLAVPLKYAGRVLGVLNVTDTERKGGFSEDQIRLAGLLADQAAVAIENARLFEAERQRSTELARSQALVGGLAQVAARIERSRNTDEALSGLSSEFHKLGLEFWLGLLDPADGALVVRYTSPDDETGTPDEPTLGSLWRGDRIPPGGLSVCHDLLELRQPVLVDTRGLARELLLLHLTPEAAENLLHRLDLQPQSSTLCLPLQTGEGIAGALFISGAELRPEDMPQYAIFGAQVAAMLEKSRLLDEASRRAAYLETITNVASSLRAASRSREMLPLILEQVQTLFQAEGSAISLRDAASHGSRIEFSGGKWKGSTGRLVTDGEGLIGRVATSGKPLLTDNASEETASPASAVIGSLRCIACVPLTVEQETIGCLMLGRGTPFQPEEVRLLTALAEIAGNAIHRAGVMETLEQRVSERTRELGDANERLTELDRLKNEFVSNVSHELRTPITNIILYLDLLENPSREERRLQYMNVLKQEAERLGHLIEDLLTISRMERGALPIDVQPHPLDALLAAVVSAHAARGGARGVSLHHELNPECPVALVSREQIGQVFNNLLANAIAYSPAGTLVDVRSQVRQMAGQAMVGIRFHNAGPPIPAEDLPHIFERFYRGQTARLSGESGTGLGLAICQEIVARHGGWFEVESDETQGTAFTVWLPAAETGRASPSPHPTNPPAAP